MRLLVLTILEPMFGRARGEQALITIFDDGEATIAFRPDKWTTWSESQPISVDEPVDGPIG